MPEFKGKNYILSDSSNDDDLDSCCPLCCEEFDETDKSLVPCPCGYQICVWCLNEILQRDTLGGRCPACRREYREENLVPQQPVTSEPRKKKRKRNKQNHNQNHQQQNRKDLSNVRVIQRNLVYVVGLPWEYAEEDLLRENPYFGQYGTIKKIVVNKSNPHTNHSNSGYTVSAYVTYSCREEALCAIECVDGSWLDGRMLRASFGTTKYCSYFLRGVPCNNQECMYLHDFGDENDTFTKEDMVNCKAEFQKQIHPINNPPQTPIDIEGLPPPSSAEEEEEEEEEEKSQNENEDSSAPITVTSNPSKGSLDSSKVSLLPSNAMWGSQNKQKKQDTKAYISEKQQKSKKDQTKSKTKKKSKKEKKIKTEKQSNNESRISDQQDDKNYTNQFQATTFQSSVPSSPSSSYRSDEDSQILSATSSEADPSSVGPSPSMEPIGGERKLPIGPTGGNTAPGAPTQPSLSKEMKQLSLGPSAVRPGQQQVPSSKNWENFTSHPNQGEDNAWEQSKLFSAFSTSNSGASQSSGNNRPRSDFDLASFIKSELQSDQEDHTDKEIENTVISSLFKQKRNQSRFFSETNNSKRPKSTYRPNQSFAPIKAGEKEFLMNHFLGQGQPKQKPMQENAPLQGYTNMFSGQSPSHFPHSQSQQNPMNQQRPASFSTFTGTHSGTFGAAPTSTPTPTPTPGFSTNSSMWTTGTTPQQGFQPQTQPPQHIGQQQPVPTYQTQSAMNPHNVPFTENSQIQNSQPGNASWSTPSTLLSLLSKSNAQTQSMEQKFGSNDYRSPLSSGFNSQNFVSSNGSTYWDSAIVGTGASYAVPEGNDAQRWMRSGPYSSQFTRNSTATS